MAAVVAILGLGITLLVSSVGSDSSPEAARASTPAPVSSDATQSPSTPDSTTDQQPGAPDAASYAIADAMSRYVDAFNSRDVQRIRSSVCSQARPAARPPTGEGSLVLDGMTTASVDGNVAQSVVLVHKEVGSERSAPRRVPATFRFEESTWFYCPGAEPDITA